MKRKKRKRYEIAEIIFQKEKEEMEKIRKSWVYSFEREMKEKEKWFQRGLLFWNEKEEKENIMKNWAGGVVL